MPVDTPQLDHLGVVYIVLAAFWTTVLLAGSAALWRLRHHESIRKRKTGLTIAAVLILQIYWCSNMVIYPLNGAYPCSINYWVMSIYFPVGIALFALHNVQLLSISARQRDLRHHPFRRSDRLTLDHLKFWRYRSSWDHMTLLSQIYFGISVCIVVQVFLSLIVFLVSRRFVPFGITGHPVPPKLCLRGWQWAVTIWYQAFWAYIFGPWLLWRIRHIKDIFHWKLQTILAIISGLPGLTMWLISTHVDSFAPVTAKFPTGLWFNPGICVMQGVALFFPLYEVYTASRHHFQIWGSQEKVLQPSSSLASSDADLESQIKGSKHSLQAFELALQNNSGELLEYASTREFTGENIIFLASVRDFKAAWAAQQALSSKNNNDESQPSPEHEQQQKFFTLATDIFDRSVSLHTAAFPINIESHVYHELDDIFGRDVVPTSSVTAPFADKWSLSAIAEITKISNAYSSKGNKPAQHALDSDGGIRGGVLNNASSEHILPLGTNSIPEGFGSGVFDRAERSVKYLVFTNTWVRYVNSWRGSNASTLSTGSVVDLKGQGYPFKTSSAPRVDL